MIVFETLDFQADIDEIDNYLYGRIDQETWQSEPITIEGVEYIKHKEILTGWRAVKVKSIQLPQELIMEDD